MLRHIFVAVVFTVAIVGLYTTSAVTLDDNNELTDDQVLQIPKYWPTEELLEVGSSSLLGDNAREEDKRNGFWNGKRNGFWNGKRNGFWNGKRSFDQEKKRNGFYNGKRNTAASGAAGMKRNGFWNGKRSAAETENAFLNLLSSKAPENEKCTPCGPEGKGQCVMYGVCCELKSGCFMLTKEADVCMTNPPTALCGGSDIECGNGGKCVADGICCDSTENSCSVDPDCDIVWY